MFTHTILPNICSHTCEVVCILNLNDIFIVVIFEIIIILPSSVQVPVQSSLTEVCLNITVRPTHTPTRESIFKPLLDYLGRWNLVLKLYSTKLLTSQPYQPSASHQEIPWLAMVFLFWSHMIHFKSNCQNPNLTSTQRLGLTRK